MQARAIFRAAHAVRERTGLAPHMEIMIPLVAYARELEMANVGLTDRRAGDPHDDVGRVHDPCRAAAARP
jgi:pyruvate,orthophosphate dikinase